MKKFLIAGLTLEVIMTILMILWIICFLTIIGLITSYSINLDYTNISNLGNNDSPYNIYGFYANDSINKMLTPDEINYLVTVLVINIWLLSPILFILWVSTLFIVPLCGISSKYDNDTEVVKYTMGVQISYWLQIVPIVIANIVNIVYLSMLLHKINNQIKTHRQLETLTPSERADINSLF
ncbi:hypothetical protein [Mycoplasmopsis verecunda]|nr:hypothetical protein [Mycoplasmopsis verecunda]WPB54406.1 hypothetical protein SAM46_02865 [Mycoplasmopsis verecunda]